MVSRLYIQNSNNNKKRAVLQTTLVKLYGCFPDSIVAAKIYVDAKD